MNPQLRDAIYFYGTECGVNAMVAMKNNDKENLKYFHQKAYDKGAYPPWLIEFGKNLMNSCDNNAILFTGGDADFDICTYLQLHQNYRTDLTIIPIDFIDRPWYVKFLKYGLDSAVRKINIHLTDEQIMDIRPFKWDTTNVYIDVSKALKTEFNLDNNFQFQWEIQPDLVRNSKANTMEGSSVRKFLSPQRAMLLQIIEDNFNERPIYFSCSGNLPSYGGLIPYMEYCGMSFRLIPIETNNKDLNYTKLKASFKPENLKDFYTIIHDDIPKISNCIYAYYNIFSVLAKHYKQNNQTEKLKGIIEIFKEYIAIGYDSDYDEEILKEYLE
jgi:hypothetical protein